MLLFAFTSSHFYSSLSLCYQAFNCFSGNPKWEVTATAKAGWEFASAPVNKEGEYEVNKMDGKDTMAAAKSEELHSVTLKKSGSTAGSSGSPPSCAEVEATRPARSPSTPPPSS